MNSNDLEKDLRSPDIEIQVAAIEKASELAYSLAVAAVDGLSISADPLFVADKLIRFGSIVINPLKTLMSRTADPMVGALCALVLLQFDIDSGIERLLSMLTDSELGEFVAQRLASRGIGAIREPVLGWLQGADLQDPLIQAKARGYLLALEKVGTSIPEPIRARLESVGIACP